MNFLVETKTEYTIQLINIVTPFLYEGFKSIYDESKKVSKSGEELKVFQTLQHPNVIWLHEIINDPNKDDLYLVTEYFSNVSIGDIFQKINS
jgi:serine/threonine protein kinase